MLHIAMKPLTLAGVLTFLVLGALAQGPKRDLTVELRQVEETDGGGYSAGTPTRQPLMAPQQVQVRNGETASLRMAQSLPMQWVQSVSTQNASLSTSGASANSSGGAVSQALIWMEASQGITVLPRWPGAALPVTIEIEVQTASVGERNGAELPTQSRSRLTTTVSAALGQWVTLATTGTGPQPGVISSEAASEHRRLLQLRVLAP
jgi:hypothetical protein